jgi:hypothetical protein
MVGVVADALPPPIEDLCPLARRMAVEAGWSSPPIESAEQAREALARLFTPAQIEWMREGADA